MSGASASGRIGFSGEANVLEAVLEHQGADPRQAVN
jgi:hypothetical protein